MVFYHNCGNIVPLLENVKGIQAKAYSIGNAIDIEEALKVIPADRLVIGISIRRERCGTAPRTRSAENHRASYALQQISEFRDRLRMRYPACYAMENLEAFFEAVRAFYEAD